MFLTIPIHTYTHDYIIFMEKKTNIILEHSYFTKILYSPKSITINGLFILLNLQLSNINFINNNKNVKCIGVLANLIENTTALQRLFGIEHELLENYKHYFGVVGKKNTYMIQNSFYGGTFKIYEKINKSTNMFVYRISGVWETVDKIGVTYKVESIVT
jgi:hypothetical protein